MIRYAAIASLLVVAACSQQPASDAVAAPAASTLTAPALDGANWTIDPAKSEIAFGGSHAGKAFTGRFERFAGAIRFDPADLANAKAVILVDVASAKIGDKTKDTALPKQEWLDAAGHPTARFETTSFTAKGGNAFEAQGALELKGVRTPITLPFTFTEAAGGADAVGEVTLDRIALDVGVKSDPSAEWVSREVKVSIKVHALKAS